jgi:hypothetical protein
MQTQLTLPGELTMTSGHSTTPTIIPRIEPTSSFRTLGVYLTPSGNNKGALSILKNITLQFATSITGSHLTHQEALTAYLQYLLPKVRYQPPLLSLSQTNCNQLQSTILMTFLPKLNINRHTARSIIHGPEELGGLELPHLYTTQGMEKLRLFLGHLRLQDRTATLIHCDITILQLLSGVGSFILKQQYTSYTWIESGWEFLTKVNFKLIYPRQWLPNLSRIGDSYLMDLFLRLELPQSTMISLNRCRLYLQVITVSDIASADGTYILPQYRTGTLTGDRVSSLFWPTQGRPTRSEWHLWHQMLQHLEIRQKLKQPLGDWWHHPHQTWQYFVHPPISEVYHILDGFITRCYPPIVLQNPRTRSQHRQWYDHQRSIPTRTVPGQLILVTIVHNGTLHGSLFQINYSTNGIPNSTLTSLLAATPYTMLLELHQHPLPLLALQSAAEAGQLTVVCSSNFDTLVSLTTATISFYSTEELYSHTTNTISSAD